MLVLIFGTRVFIPGDPSLALQGDAVIGSLRVGRIQTGTRTVEARQLEQDSRPILKFWNMGNQT